MADHQRQQKTNDWIFFAFHLRGNEHVLERPGKTNFRVSHRPENNHARFAISVCSLLFLVQSNVPKTGESEDAEHIQQAKMKLLTMLQAIPVAEWFAHSIYESAESYVKQAMCG